MAADYTRVWGNFHGAVSHLRDAIPDMVDADLEALASEAFELIEEIEAERRARAGRMVDAEARRHADRRIREDRERLTHTLRSLVRWLRGGR